METLIKIRWTFPWDEVWDSTIATAVENAVRLSLDDELPAILAEAESIARTKLRQELEDRIQAIEELTTHDLELEDLHHFLEDLRHHQSLLEKDDFEINVFADTV